MLYALRRHYLNPNKGKVYAYMQYVYLWKLNKTMFGMLV